METNNPTNNCNESLSDTTENNEPKDTEMTNVEQSITTNTSSISQNKLPDMETSNLTDNCNETVNDTTENNEPEDTDMTDVEQSITTSMSSIPQKKLPDLEMSNLTDNCNETVNDMTENNEPEDTEMTNVKQSTTTKTSSISQKKQPDQLCSCPLHCDTKISKEWREKIYKQFGELGDHSLQNLYIQRHIKIKSIAKRLWEDEIIDKKIQRRVTCKYLIPLTGSVKESFSYAKTLSYDSAKFAIDTNGLDTSTKLNSSPNAAKENDTNTTEPLKEPPVSDIEMKEISQYNGNTSNMKLNQTTETKISENDWGTKESGNLINMEQDSASENKSSENGSSTKENVSDMNSPSSFNDNESINTVDESNVSELENFQCSNVKYVDVCQKAFMNMYGITEKRIRWQREKLILKSRYLAEKEKKELEEMDRTLSLARSLGAGCQPLFAFLEKSEYKHLSEQLLIAIEDDVMLVNNFFRNQLWKPEDIMNKSMHLSTTLDSCETECD